MTKRCTLKESFVEKQLDKFQPDWRKGDDITTETKQKIKDYVASKLPKELKEDATCITDFSIWHMARKIREREKLPNPKRTNRGNKVSVRIPQTNEEGITKQVDSNKENNDISANSHNDEQKEPTPSVAEHEHTLAQAIQALVVTFGYGAVVDALLSIQQKLPPERGEIIIDKTP